MRKQEQYFRKTSKKFGIFGETILGKSGSKIPDLFLFGPMRFLPKLSPADSGIKIFWRKGAGEFDDPKENYGQPQHDYERRQQMKE